MYYDSAVEKQLSEALRGVPQERWFEVLDYLRSLQPAGSRPDNGGEPIRTAADLAASPLVGLWADRDDIGDCVTFARRLRRQAEARGGDA